MILELHYAKRKPSISWAYGYYEGTELVGVLTIGKPASNTLCDGVAGKENSKRVYELNRLVFSKHITNGASKLIAYALKDLKKNNLIIVSYSDSGMNHYGYVYQATNWMYTGRTKERTDKYVPFGKHSRHYDGENNHLRVVRTSKHRYIYVTANKKEKKRLTNDIKYPIIKEYPKGELVHYELGSQQGRTVYNKITGKYFKEFQ